MRTRFFVLAAIVAASLGACVIGPKQEDPAATGLPGDASYDEDARAAEDTSVVAVPTAETGESVDGAGGAFSDAAATDARGDATSDSANDAAGDAPGDADALDGG